MTATHPKGVTPVQSAPITTNAYAAAIDALTVDPTDIPRTIRAAAGAIRAALDGLGSWGADGWQYQAMNNWPHAGYIAGGVHARGAVADVHAAANAGPYVALMGPPMARAIVDWLEGAATREERCEDEIPAQQRQQWTPDNGDEAFGALVVAHTVLAHLTAGRPLTLAGQR